MVKPEASKAMLACKRLVRDLTVILYLIFVEFLDNFKTF